MTNRFYNLTFNKLSDGAIRLTQTECGEDCIIDAHPEQILFIARQLCGMKSETSQQVSDLERRIAVLADDLQKLVCADWFRKEIIKYCGHGVEMLCRLDALLDLAIEFDGGRLEPEEHAPEDCEDHPQSQHPKESSKTPCMATAITSETSNKQLGLAV